MNSKWYTGNGTYKQRVQLDVLLRTNTVYSFQLFRGWNTSGVRDFKWNDGNETQTWVKLSSFFPYQHMAQLGIGWRLLYSCLLRVEQWQWNRAGRHAGRTDMHEICPIRFLITVTLFYFCIPPIVTSLEASHDTKWNSGSETLFYFNIPLSRAIAIVSFPLASSVHSGNETRRRAESRAHRHRH